MLGIPHAYATADIPGVGGRIRVRLEDFIVGEEPLYLPCGEGEHVYFEIEKRDLSTLEAVERLAGALRRNASELGYAGLKDRKGVTRQTLSISGVTPDEVLALHVPKMRILSAQRHTNKLRVGHLAGNRFEIRVRDVEPGSDERVAEIVRRVSEFGIPNYYGPQRFGNRGDAQWIGATLLRHDHRAAVRRVLGRPSTTEGNPRVVKARHLFEQMRWHDAWHSYPASYREERRMIRYLLSNGERYRGAIRLLRPQILKLYFSAFQSYLFNVVLERRLERRGRLDELIEGDIAFLHENGALFAVADVEAEMPRVARFEISPSGPIFGQKMLVPEGVPAADEHEALEELGVRSTDFHQLAQRCRLEGGRRPLRVPVRGLVWQRDGDDYVFSFFLPKGAYATTFLREVMKNEIIPPAYHGGRADASGVASTESEDADGEASP